MTEVEHLTRMLESAKSEGCFPGVKSTWTWCKALESSTEFSGQFVLSLNNCVWQELAYLSRLYVFNLPCLWATFSKMCFANAHLSGYLNPPGNNQQLGSLLLSTWNNAGASILLCSVWCSLRVTISKTTISLCGKVQVASAERVGRWEGWVAAQREGGKEKVCCVPDALCSLV